MKNVLGSKSKKSNQVFLIIILFLILIVCEIFAFYIVNNASNKKITIEIIIETLEKLSNNNFSIKFTNENFYRFIDIQPMILLAVLTIGIFAYTSSMSMKGNFEGIEQGSANWTTSRDLKSFKDKRGLILGEGLYMSLKPKNPKKLNYNLHQVIIGASQVGKSFRKLLPDIMQVNTNLVITDSKGTLYKETAPYLIKNGYTIKVLNLIELNKSHKFNPLQYIKDEKDVLILADTFIKNTEGQQKSSHQESFWIKGETALLQALVFYIVEEEEKASWTFQSIIDLLLISDSNGVQQLIKLDEKFANLKEDHPAKHCWKSFRLSAGETAAGILVGLAVRFNIFSSQELRDLTSHDQMDLESLTTNTANVAYYIIIPDTYRTFDVISAMFFSQTFQYLVHYADFKLDGKLPLHTRFLMDEFANIGYIPNFDNYLATIQSRNMSVSFALQELQQLKMKYKDNWESLIGNCSTLIYMGSPSNFTREYISKMLGKTTIHNVQKTLNYGSKGGRSEQRQNAVRDLLTPDELRTMPTTHQIIIINGLNAIYCEKYKTEKKNIYKELVSTKKKESIFKKLIQLFSRFKQEEEKEKI